MLQQPMHAEEECKAGFHFLETDPSYSIPPAEWLFIIGFVFLILIGVLWFYVFEGMCMFYVF